MSGARIRIVDSGDGRLHLRWWADDTVQWHQILASFKSRFPTHGDRSFSSRTKTWSVPARHYSRLAEWADYWFDEQDQEWLDEEWAGQAGEGEHSRTYSRSGYGQYSRQQTRTSTSTVEAAYSHLCLTPDAPAELVKTVHHWWVRALHPDTGHGDGAHMASINAAVDVIREDQERRAS